MPLLIYLITCALFVSGAALGGRWACLSYRRQLDSLAADIASLRRRNSNPPKPMPEERKAELGARLRALRGNA